MAEPLDPNVWRRVIRRRVIVIAVMFGLWATTIEARLFYFQVYQHEFLETEGQKQQQHLIEAPARRGDLLDRHGRVLAYSVDADTVNAEPVKIEVPRDAIAKLCQALDGCSAQERQGLQAQFERRRGFAYVRRRVSIEQARRVAALDITGVFLTKEPRRYYPNRELASHLLGYVGLDDKGLGGLEATYDATVRGRSGMLLVHSDLKGHAFSRVGDPPVPGASLELTIDANLQYLAERELKAGVEANRAAGGVAVIMDPRTGEVLAMANEPTFNPNVYARADEDHRRNRAVQDVYEPGSTFKMITATAGLEEKVVTPDTLIETGNGALRMGYRTVRDTHAHGTIPFSDVIALSSNIGSIRVGWRLGAERLGKYVARFGFGKRLSPDFPGENAGLVWNPAEWTPNGALASVAMGYQIGVTPLQMAAAASAIANGGELVQPRVLRAVIEGNRRREIPRRVLGRVASADTMATLTTLLEAVVERGTAKVTKVEGYSIAGKTGTSAKLVGGRYSGSEYNASFVGFVPSRAPAMTILVWIDTPRAGSTYGGTVAGPVFQRIASEALRYLAIPPTINPAAPVFVRRDAGSEIRIAGPAGPLSLLTPARPPTAGEVVLPELRGLGGREALRMLAKLGLSARVSGDGVVLEQDPPAGTPVEPGANCRLALGRSPLRETAVGGLHP
jgi:cell division protein FtsI (penicillin-binding protein 3)